MSIRFDRQPISMLCGGIAASAGAGVVEIENADAWFNAVGLVTTIDFVLDTPQILSDQYVGLGVLFPDGNDVAFAAATFDLDGWGAKGAPTGGGNIVVELLGNHHAFASHYYGMVVYSLYLDDALIDTSTLFGAPAGGAFAGVTSLTPFNRVIISDPLGTVYVDNLYFDTVPAPAAGVLFATLILGSGRRRR